MHLKAAAHHAIFLNPCHFVFCFLKSKWNHTLFSCDYFLTILATMDIPLFNAVKPLPVYNHAQLGFFLEQPVDRRMSENQIW